MKSIKTGFVVVVMLAVAYGVWVMLNKKPIAGQLSMGDLHWSTPDIKFGPPGGPAPAPEGRFAPPVIETSNEVVAQPDTQPNYVAPSPSEGPSHYESSPSPIKPAPVLSPEEYANQNPTPSTGYDPAGSRYSGGGQLQPPSTVPSHEAVPRYEETPDAASGSTSADGAASPLGATGFMNAWRGAQDQLAQGELADALFTLSLWYDSPDVPADMRPQLVELLDQLAGHVIYSPEHLLEPPHEVRPGESLEAIAAQYEVPWQLLANINGISDPSQIQDGMPLKVIRGPFSATINLERQELLLSVGRRYAGRFAIGVGNDPAPMTGDYIVREKEEERTFYDREGRAIEPGAPENPYGPYWIGLGGRLAIHGAPAGEAERESTGSIVVSPDDAADLFAILSKDSPVAIRR